MIALPKKVCRQKLIFLKEDEAHSDKQANQEGEDKIQLDKDRL